MRLNRLGHADADAELRAYLLGQLPEEQRERVEERVFGDESTHEELLAIEDDLIDEYVRGELTGSERTAFESHFVASDRRARKISIARGLAASLAAAPRRDALAGPSLQGMRLAWVAAAAGVALAAVMWFALRSTPHPSPESQPPTAPVSAGNPASPSGAPPGTPEPPASASDPAIAKPAAPVVASLVLVPGSSRDLTAGTRLLIPSTADAVLAELHFDRTDYQQFAAVLRIVGGREVWKSGTLRARTSGERSIITVRWPASRLPPDDYLVTLSGVPGGGAREDIADYYFRVVRGADGRR